MHALASVGAIAVLAIAAACGSDSATPPDDTITGELSVAMSVSASILVPAQRATLTVTATRDGVPVSSSGATFATSNEPVATVTATGEITAVAPGTVTLTATLEGTSASITVTVREGGMIGAAGGTLSTADGVLELVFPAGALTQSTPVSLAALSAGVDPTVLDGSVYQIGTSTLTFAQPVTVRIKFVAQNTPFGLPLGALGVRRAAVSGWTDRRPSTVDVAGLMVTSTIIDMGTYAVGRLVPETPCTSDAHRVLDFWIGNWNVTASGVGAGLSNITLEPGGCAIYEEYITPGAPAARSISFYEPTTDSWYQTYLDGQGARLVLTSLSYGPGQLVTRTPGVGNVWDRWSWIRLPDGRVRQVGERTTNNGQSFGSPHWDGLYTRR